MLVERIAGGTTLGVVGQWNPIALGDAYGVRFSLGLRGFAGWGDEPGTESARRERRGISPVLYLHFSQPSSATQVYLTTGFGYHYHRVTGASDDEKTRDPSLMYVGGGRLASHTGLSLVHSRGRLGLFGSIAMGRESLGARDQTGVQLGLGVSVR
jgi:hypothetical protein